MQKLADIDTRAPKGFNKEDTKAETVKIIKELDELQNLLYASAKYSILIILQGMDASGKDGLIKDIFTGINPHGISISSFKVPTEEERSHDFLWRIHKAAPAKGTIKIFNRSHYEDVLITRVHDMIDDETAKKKMQAINDFESLLQTHNNTRILKFYLHVSKEEQAERLAERMKNPAKMWKYNPLDEKETNHRERYLKYYEEIFQHCNQPAWHIVPADQNWYKAHLVAKTLRDALKKLDMKYPLIKK